MTSTNPALAAKQISGPLINDVQLINDLLVTYCPKLTNSAKPGSYVLPSRFSHRHPDNPKYGKDECRKKIESGEWEKGKRECKHREERESVRPLMDAIDELARCANAPHPFLAIEGLSLHIAKEDLLRELRRSNIDESQIRLINPCLREYDVILIGEKFGAIIIEVKGSEYANDFVSKSSPVSHRKNCCSQLPERYAEAFVQVNSADSLLLLIEHFEIGANLKVPINMTVRKIVFAPRLSKLRYDQWFDGLEQQEKSIVEGTVGSVHQWFEEDLEQGALLGKLRQLIEEPGFSIDPKLFRRCNLILAFLKAYPILKCRRDPSKMAKLEALFSERHARMNDFTALQLQNPELVLEDPKIKVKDKVFKLTPEQETALRGPDQQLIFGTGGTGKTVVLTQRAIDCLDLGRSVLVLTTESFMESYHARLQPAFQQAKPLGAKFEIRSWPKLLWSTLSEIPKCHRIIWDIYRHEIDVVTLASKLVSSESGKQLFRLLAEFDDVILDDALEYTITVDRRMNTNMKSLFVSLAMMVYLKQYPGKSIWIGLDPKAIQWKYDPHCRIFRDTTERLRKDESLSSVLTLVMRNGEEIFNFAYEPKFAQRLKPYQASCGHKILGRVHRVTIRPDNSEDFEPLWNATLVQLAEYLVVQNYKRSEIGIIVGGTGSFTQRQTVIQFLLQKCREFQIPAESLDFQKFHTEKLKGSSATASAIPDEKITIDFWHQASSREWPIVIYVEMLELASATRSFDAVRIHRQYRARTRAVSELVELRVLPSTSKRELLKCGASNCCTREIELYGKVSPMPLTDSQKLIVLRLIKENEAILFGKFKDEQCGKAAKSKAWQQIVDKCTFEYDFDSTDDTDWTNLCDTIWPNWKLVAKRKVEEALWTECRLNKVDEAVLDIIGWTEKERNEFDVKDEPIGTNEASSGNYQYFPSYIHDFHGESKCPKYADGTFRSEKRTERLDDVANVALQLRDDLYRDMDPESHCIPRKAREDYERRLFSKIRKRCHSVSDFHSTNDARHPALVLDCDLFEIVTRSRELPLHHHKDSRLGKLEQIEAYLENRAVKRDIIKLMEKVLWWKLQISRPNKEERLQEMDEHQNILAMALDSLQNIKKFGECVFEVARSVSSVSPSLSEYLRVKIIEIYEGGSWYPVKDDREVWRH